MDKSESILKAIKLLSENGYIVIRKSKQMEADICECIKMDEKGEYKDCSKCSCNLCIMNK